MGLRQRKAPEGHPRTGEGGGVWSPQFPFCGVFEPDDTSLPKSTIRSANPFHTAVGPGVVPLPHPPSSRGGSGF